MKIKKILAIGLILAVPIFGLYVFINRNALTSLDVLKNPNVVLAFIYSSLILLTAHTIRAYKTKLFIDSIKITSMRTHLRALFIGYLFNTLLPFRLGEFIRAYVLGKGTRMSSTFMFGLVLVDRAVDGLFIGTLALFILLATPLFGSSLVHGLVLLASTIIIAISLAVLTMIMIVKNHPEWFLRICYRITRQFNDNLRDSIRFKLWSLMYGLERVLIKKLVIKYTVISFIMWTLYIAALMPITYILTQSISASSATSVSVISYLGVSEPAGPSHIGSYQTFVQPFIDSRSDKQSVRTILILGWLIQVLPAFLVGLVFVFRTQETTKKPSRKSKIVATDDKLLRNFDISNELSSFLEAFYTNNSLSRIMHRFELNKNSKLIHYFKGGSNAVTALVFENNKFLVRKLTAIQYKYKLESQYKWLKNKKKLNRIVNAINEETHEGYYKIDLEYNKDYIPYFDYIHSMPIEKSKKILTEVYEYLFKYVYQFSSPQLYIKDLEEYIENRCIKKLNQAAEVNDEIRGLLQYQTLYINGRSYKNIPWIINSIRKDKNLINTFATYRKCSIHGDVTIDNILVSKSSSKFLLIDPTDNENEISGPVFDFGRTSQSLLYGYEFLCRDDQQVEVVENVINFEFSKSNQYEELDKHLKEIQKKFLTDIEMQSVNFHTAVLYSRMLTHRVEINPKNAVKFYAISVIAFNNIFEGVF